MNHTAYIAHTENFMNSMFFMVKKKNMNHTAHIAHIENFMNSMFFMV